MLLLLELVYEGEKKERKKEMRPTLPQPTPVQKKKKL